MSRRWSLERVLGRACGLRSAIYPAATTKRLGR